MPTRSYNAPYRPLLALSAALGLALSGCATIDEAKDLEMARGEGRYVPVELIGSLALGVMRAGDYGTYSSVVHQSYSAGDPITSDGCASVSLVDGMGTDGEGTVVYDFDPCSARGGRVQVTQRVHSDLLDEERDANVAGKRRFDAFAPPGASASDRAIAGIGLGLVEQQKTCGTARRRAQQSHEEHKNIADAHNKGMEAPLVTNTLGTYLHETFYGNPPCTVDIRLGLVSNITEALAPAAHHEVTALHPFDPTIGQVVTTRAEGNPGLRRRT